MSVTPAQTGAETWRWRLPCGHVHMRRQVTYPIGTRGAYRCSNCGALWPDRMDMTGRRAYE